MRRDLRDPIPEAPLPDGLEVRPVRPEHHRAIWDADAEAFQDHWDRAVVTDEDFERFYAEPDLDTSMWQVAWDGEEVAGLVINTIFAHENEKSGELVGWLDSVATRRAWRRRGVAGALIARSLQVLRERGMEVAKLGVDTQSQTGALGLYESFGFRPTRTWMFLRKPFEA
jgi:ribosomal protein S18 acetylase RimI-like enzyme